MEEKGKGGISFNKRRTEGKDKDQPKNLQLKTRKLNPVNTISYMQVAIFVFGDMAIAVSCLILRVMTKELHLRDEFDENS